VPNEMVSSGDAQALLVQRAGMLAAPDETGDLGHAREVAGVKAADHPGADDADPLDHDASLEAPTQ